METNWLSDLKKYDISKVVLSELKKNTVNYFYFARRLFFKENILPLNISIIDLKDFNEFLKNSKDGFTIGILSNLLINIPEDSDTIKIEEIVNRNDGLHLKLQETFLRHRINKDSYNRFSENNNYGIPSKLYVMGENLAFTKLSTLKDIGDKNSKAIIFTHLVEEDVIVLFNDTYWEVIRESPMNFNTFIKTEDRILI